MSGLTPREHETLANICICRTHRFSPSLTQLAQMMDCDKSAVSHLAERLLQKKVIKRTAKKLAHSRYGGIRVSKNRHHTE